jgi:isopropylmalate/homocitrate/citramalate synthase
VGFDFIEGGYPLSNEKDVAFFEEVQRLGLRHATVCAFGALRQTRMRAPRLALTVAGGAAAGMTRKRGVSAESDPGMLALLRSEAPVVTVVGKSWDFHVSMVLRVSLDENVAMVAESVGFLVGEGRRVVYDAEHFFDGYKVRSHRPPARRPRSDAHGAERSVEPSLWLWSDRMCARFGPSQANPEHAVRVGTGADGGPPHPSRLRIHNGPSATRMCACVRACVPSAARDAACGGRGGG